MNKTAGCQVEEEGEEEAEEGEEDGGGDGGRRGRRWSKVYVVNWRVLRTKGARDVLPSLSQSWNE